MSDEKDLVIPGWSEGPDPESRDSGFDASHRPGMTSRFARNDAGYQQRLSRADSGQRGPPHTGCAARCSSISSLTRAGAWSAAKCPTPGSTSKR
ncbi:hypothetical protein FFI89_021415 [Bradyrhizobium sp. KBS0727]|nr:hypothetical protein FFI71_021420 [Bradyrhizobium sp. KBS0725]QDW46075.1 hypothetical protein FFI89_021415 [Bradyrhizobium sp. KBS0727]